MPRHRLRFLVPLLPLLAAVPLFFTGWGQGPASPWRQLNGMAHLGWFGILAWGFAILPPVPRRPLPAQLAIPLAAVLAIGGGIELLQPRFGRSTSWGDLGLDLLGGLLGLLFLAPGRRSLPRRLLAASRIAVLSLAGLALAGPAAVLWDMGQAARRFPVLGDFESRLEAGRWAHGTIDRTLSRHGGASLRVALNTEPYSGTTLRRCFGNWQGYATLALSIHNPDPVPLRLTISIRDRVHFARGGRYDDRYNRSFRIEPGWNDLRMPIAEIEESPADRILDLNDLLEMVIFAANLPTPRVIHLDDLRLLP